MTRPPRPAARNRFRRRVSSPRLKNAWFRIYASHVVCARNIQRDTLDCQLPATAVVTGAPGPCVAGKADWRGNSSGQDSDWPAELSFFWSRDALVPEVSGAEPVTVPSGAGNVTDQYSDSARARRSRATFCAACASCAPAFAAFCSELLRVSPRRARRTRRKAGGGGADRRSENASHIGLRRPLRLCERRPDGRGKDLRSGTGDGSVWRKTGK
jgi:hypothetical protein